MTLLVGHPSEPVVDGLAAVLSARLSVDDVRTATEREAFVHAAQRDLPNAAVVDVSLDPANVALLCTTLSRIGVPVVVMTRHDGAGSLDLLTAGAKGICPVDDGVDGVVTALHTVLEGNTYVPPQLLGTLLRDLIDARREAVPDPSPVDRLSPREREVLGLLGSGADHLEIATRLTISPNTAKTHINRLLAKLNLRSRVEAASLAIAYGITPSENGGNV